MHLRLHLPSLSDVPGQSSLHQQSRLQQVIAQSFERAATIVGLSHVQVEIVRDETSEASRAGAATGREFHRDQVHYTWFPEIAVLLHGESDYVYAGGSPYVAVKNLACAFRWGAALFGMSGYVVLQPKGASLTDRFYVLRLVRLTGQGRSVGVKASILPLQDYVTVTVVDRKGVAYFRKRVNDPWNFAQVGQTLAKIPANQSAIDLSIVRFIVMMDRAIFAEMPWEKRAEYLELLLLAWTGEHTKHVVLEIIYSTRTGTELEATFALLRERGKYDELFADLDEQLYHLLQFLAEFVPDQPINYHYLVSLLSDIKILPAATHPIPSDSWERLQRAAGELLVWVQNRWESLEFHFDGSGEIPLSVNALTEFLWIVENARQDDLQAQMFVTRMLTLAGDGSVRALLGLQYIEEIGTPYDQREHRMGKSDTLRKQLEGILIYDLLAWFTSMNEWRQVLQSVESLPEWLALLMKVVSTRQTQKLEVSGVAPSIIELLEPYTVSSGRMTTQMIEGLQALAGCPAWDQARLLDLLENIPPANLQAFLQTMTFVHPFSLETWETQTFKELAQRPAALAFIREVGSDLMSIAFIHMANSWERFESWLVKLAIKRTRMGNPLDYQCFLQRMRTGEAAAFAEVTEEEWQDGFT